MAAGSDESGVTHKKAHEAVDELKRLIETKFEGFHVAEIIKGGSLGHGTAVSGHLDVDLVVYSNDVKVEKIKNSGFGYYLKDLYEFLCHELDGSDYVQTDREKELVTTGKSIQFKYKENIEVDLLVSPNWKSWSDLHAFLGKEWSQNDCKDYSVFASKWQVEFFKDKPSKVKDFVRKAKMWRNEMWPSSKHCPGKPSSYLMSLLVVRAYENGGAEGINEALKDIVRGSPNIYWENFYTVVPYQEGLIRLPGHPRVLDPANPVNNVWETGFNDYNPGERHNDYEPGDGNFIPLREKIDSIDLHQPDGVAKDAKCK